MAHDDDKPDAGDDPWAGLEANESGDLGDLSELGGPGEIGDLGNEFSFSFDDEAPLERPVESSVAEDPAAPPDLLAFADAVAEEPAPAADLAPAALSDAPAEEVPEEDADPFAAIASASGLDTSPAAELEAEVSKTGDLAIDDWLSEDADADAAASSVFAGMETEDGFTEGGEAADVAASESTVSIGTGSSGIASPSSIESAEDADQAAGDVANPFAVFPAETTDEADPWGQFDEDGDSNTAAPEASSANAGDGFSFMDEVSEGNAFSEGGGFETEPAEDAAGDFAAGFGVGAGVTASAEVINGETAGRSASKPKRPAPPRKKKPSMVGQMVGVVVGGVMAFPIVFAILIWGFGQDPFKLTPMVPDSMAFLLPSRFRPGGGDGLSQAPSLDDLVGADQTGGVEDGLAGISDGGELTSEPEPEPEPEPIEPSPNDLASVDPSDPDATSEPIDDPLMSLLDETANVVEPPALPQPEPAPEPEPLDLDDLDSAVAAAATALEAVVAVDDPEDPIRRELLARWYLSLAVYAQELATLERLAAESGRPFEPAIEKGEAIRTSLASHPELIDAMAWLSRKLIAYAKRSSDGLVIPATFVRAKLVGPYWRSQVTLAGTEKYPSREMVVLTRSEPAVAPGDTVVVTGLTVDDDVVWASDLRGVPAADDGFGFPDL